MDFSVKKATQYLIVIPAKAGMTMRRDRKLRRNQVACNASLQKAQEKRWLPTD